MKECRTLRRNSSLAQEELQNMGEGGTALDS